SYYTCDIRHLHLPYFPPISPCRHREDFKLILREVRRNNNNTLSGLSLDSIADQVRSIIETRERNKPGGAESGSKGKPCLPLPPVAQAPPPINTSAEYTDEWSCVICYEDMDSSDSSRLMCGHRFHTECIKSWFKEQNTCPTCRNYALLPDEYPFLSH
ncbi:E3 ubiquitin-protein ligase TTC3, partial [Geodia barretti]